MKEPDLKKNFLTTMRGVASTVCVVSAKDQGERHAMTATSVTSLSMEPPSMLICINKEASIHKLISKDSSFCINILSNNQRELAEVCSDREEGESRFKSEAWKDSEDFIFNEESLSNIFCSCIDLIEYTSHTIFIGKVLRSMNNENLKPLIYASGNYLD